MTAAKTPKDRVFLQAKLEAKIASEGYCCLQGYLRLCQTRGETAKGMAKNVNLHRFTIYYHFRAMKQGARPCQKRKDCLLPIIDEFEKEKLAATKKGP